MLWDVEVVLENKKAARDPVVETIKRDLLAKKGYDMILNVRSGQYLRMNIDANNEEKAKDMVEKMCNELRIYNPITQTLTILNVKQS
ncbi:MAG: phosphoribosylformylglycinamidine synthase subunit PurS [Candidatus Lokiarchaeota archaeon]|nr:phosphoribosylformylglycinamidine synthase subunit PurS [Candidatus Lokiarchaeota archaeon]